MTEYFFFNGIRKTTVQFLHMFSNIKIAKYNSDGTVNKFVNVPIKLAHKEKFYYWLNDRSAVKRLPMIGIGISGLRYDGDRMGNKNMEFKFLTQPTSASKPFLSSQNLFPWNIDYSMQIATEFMTEADQILEQILPFFNPNVFMTIDIPEIKNSFNVKVVLRNISPRISTELQLNEYRNILWDLQFEAQTYLMKPVSSIGLIDQINLNFWTGLTSATSPDIEAVIVKEEL